MCTTVITVTGPDDWQTAACLTLIHKNGCCGNPASYKLTSLISTPGKKAEALIKGKAYEPMDRYGLLAKSQHASYEGKSCFTHHTESLEEVNKQKDKGNTSDTFGFLKSL